jgi:hypothetical protein
MKRWLDAFACAIIDREAVQLSDGFLAEAVESPRWNRNILGCYLEEIVVRHDGHDVLKLGAPYTLWVHPEGYDVAPVEVEMTPQSEDAALVKAARVAMMKWLAAELLSEAQS